MPDFVDFPWDVLHFLWSAWGLGGDKVGEVVTGGEEGRDVVSMKNGKKLLNNKI